MEILFHEFLEAEPEAGRSDSRNALLKTSFCYKWHRNWQDGCSCYVTAPTFLQWYRRQCVRNLLRWSFAFLRQAVLTHWQWESPCAQPRACRGHAACRVFAWEVLNVLEASRETSELGLLMDVEQGEVRPPPPPPAAREFEACAQLPSSSVSVGMRFHLHCYFAVRRKV